MRAIDRLDTAPRFSEHDAIRLNRMFRGADTEEWLAAVFEDDLVGETAIGERPGAPPMWSVIDSPPSGTGSASGLYSSTNWLTLLVAQVERTLVDTEQSTVFRPGTITR